MLRGATSEVEVAGESAGGVFWTEGMSSGVSSKCEGAETTGSMGEVGVSWGGVMTGASGTGIGVDGVLGVGKSSLVELAVVGVSLGIAGVSLGGMGNWPRSSLGIVIVSEKMSGVSSNLIKKYPDNLSG